MAPSTWTRKTWTKVTRSSCDECGADLKVVSTDPLEIESAEELEDEEEEALEDEEEEEEDWK